MNRNSLLLLLAFIATPAVAHAGDAAIMSTTRELAKQGLEAFDAGRFDEAVEKLSKAYSVVHVPTLAVATARAMAKIGKLVAASELYLEATRMPQDKSWQATQLEAQKDAERERSQLLQRIARIEIAVSGAAAKDIAVRIDGIAVPQALVDAEQMVDPGLRQVEGTCGGEVVTRSVTVKEGDRSRIDLPFAPGCAIAAPAATPYQPATGKGISPVSSATEPPTLEPRPGRAQRILGWTTLSVGGVGLAVGATTGLIAVAKRASLQDTRLCSGESCPDYKSGEVNSYNGMRDISTVGFIAGGVLAAAGLTLLITAPKQASKPNTALWVSPSSAGIFGRF